MNDVYSLKELHNSKKMQGMGVVDGMWELRKRADGKCWATMSTIII